MPVVPQNVGFQDPGVSFMMPSLPGASGMQQLPLQQVPGVQNPQNLPLQQVQGMPMLMGVPQMPGVPLQQVSNVMMGAAPGVLPAQGDGEHGRTGEGLRDRRAGAAGREQSCDDAAPRGGRECGGRGRVGDRHAEAGRGGVPLRVRRGCAAGAWELRVPVGVARRCHLGEERATGSQRSAVATLHRVEDVEDAMCPGRGRSETRRR